MYILIVLFLFLFFLVEVRREVQIQQTRSYCIWIYCPCSFGTSPLSSWQPSVTSLSAPDTAVLAKTVLTKCPYRDAKHCFWPLALPVPQRWATLSANLKWRRQRHLFIQSYSGVANERDSTCEVAEVRCCALESTNAWWPVDTGWSYLI